MTGHPFIFGAGYGGSGGGGGGATLTIGVFSDAGLTTPVTSGNYGSTVYIKANPTGITPTSYTFSIDGSTDKIVTQAGDTYAWTIDIVGAVSITARASDGVSVAVANVVVFNFIAILVYSRGNRMRFDGVNDHCKTNNNAYPAGEWSISFWITTSVTPANDNAHCIISANTNGFDEQNLIGISTNGRVYFIPTYTGANKSYGVTPINNGVIHHVVMTKTINGANYDLRIYVDGLLETTTLSQVFTNNSGKFNVSIGYVVNGTKYFNGYLDDVTAWNTPLTLADVNEIYAGGSAYDPMLVKTANITVCEKYNETAGHTSPTTADASGLNTITMSGFTAPYGVVTY
jgi:hypothetical protein